MTENPCHEDNARPKVLLPMAPSLAVDLAGTPPPRLDQPFVQGSLEVPSGMVPRVSPRLDARDYWGTIKARFGVGRMRYTVDPGLYALGEPDENSPVLVSANYKMSFDSLRGALPGRDAWILVLDTKGINVWCAAGKGTFGTDELLLRIESSGLKDVVRHRNLIVPQLGGPGVAAHLVKRLSGFRVHYGPIDAKDLAAYLDAGMKATPAMRTKAFPLAERLVLVPIELVAALKASLFIIPAMLLLSSLTGPNGFMQNMASEGIFSIIAVAAAIFSGAVLTPALLPYLPGRAFSAKGFVMGIVTALVLIYFRGYSLSSFGSLLRAGAWLLMIPGASAYLAMNFTGASTYTSLSGVRKEMRWALPLEISAMIAGLVMLTMTGFIP